MNFLGGWKQQVPREFVQFIEYIAARAKGRGLIGWGMPRGARWLDEIVRTRAGLLDAAAMLAGYPQT